MEFIPIDFSPEHQIWARESMTRLELALESASENSQSSQRQFELPPPDEPIASLLFAELLLAMPNLRERLSGPDSVIPDSVIPDSVARDHGATHGVTHGAGDVVGGDVVGGERVKAIAEQTLSLIAQWFVDLIRSASISFDEQGNRLVQLLSAQKASTLYMMFLGKGFRHCEGRLLQAILSCSEPKAVRVGVDLLVDHPPRDWTDTSLAITALVQTDKWNVSDVFPRLLDSTNPAVLSPALDLANLLVRERGANPHPAASRFDSLLNLLGGVTQQLAAMEENPRRFSNSVAEIQRILFNSVSLVVSLCDFFALSGDSRAIGKLTQALDLSHRRIKVEAAFALAKLGEERARDLLLGMVSDDASRPRILAYAHELGIDERIDPQWLSSLAKAKSDLALWLSQPDQFSIPPHHLELVEQRTLVWPGFDGPQECFLIRFEYYLGETTHSNIGFSGPFSQAFSLDLNHLSPDRCYEIFLAHDVEDPSEARYRWDRIPSFAAREANRLAEELSGQGFQEIQGLAYCEFLGHRAALCAALDSQGVPQVVAWDGEMTLTATPSPSAVDLLHLQWKGYHCMDALTLE